MAALDKTSSGRSICIIGKNGEGQFGIGNKTPQKHLVKCGWSEPINIRKIYAANRYHLVETTDGNYYSAGYNGDGACTAIEDTVGSAGMNYNYFGQCTVSDDSWNILNMTPITYFKQNNIKISEVFVSNEGDAPFWKAQNGTIYTSCNSNMRGRVGAEADNAKLIHKIPFLSELSIKKMVSGFWCSIAICNDGSVYSTGTGTAYGEYGQNGLGAKGVHNRSWKRIEGLKDIVDCDFGSSFVVFLSSSGRVFSAGLNHRGQLGLDTKEDKHIMRDPTEITYFRENDIAIQSVRCCSTGVVALDGNGNVYQWGVSLTGGSDLLCPQKIKLKEKVVSIETGHDHCICRTEKGHFVSIGNGDYGECCRDNVDDKSPQNINAWILRQIKAKETKILSVIPGANCTVILVSSMDARTKNKHPLARVQSVEATPEQKQATDDESANEIGDFLSELGLGRYLSAFRDEGFETMDELQEINESQLKEIGLKMAHRLKLLKKIRAFFTAKSYDASSTKHKEERKEDDEDVRKDNITRSNGLIICVGIAEYDELDNLETAADIEMYRALFEDKYHYKVIANDPSKRMTKKDLKRFLLNVRKDHLYDFDDYKLYYDALVVTFGGHGTYDSIICSDGSRCKHKELRNIFLIDELMEIPKIFLIDACRMDDDCDVPTQKARNAPTASTFSTTLMACEGNAVYGAQICRFITEGLSESYDNDKYTDFRTVYIAAKKRIKQATQADQDLQLCEHDTDIESVVFKPNRAYSRSYSQRQRRGTNAKRYCGDTKQTSTVDFTRKFLKKLGMERHYDAFEAKGVLDEASLKDVNKGTLIWLGIRNESSQEAILNAIKNLK